MTQDSYFPIIYVRGYAMTQKEMDDTTADPFCGFNLGSTVYRAIGAKDAPARKFVFESPLVRLMAEFGYTDVFDGGQDLVDSLETASIPKRSVIIYHYYEEASRLLGRGETPAIEHFAEGLSRLVARVRQLVCNKTENGLTFQDFRCHLVAHSMGGLVCRAFLQNPACDPEKTRACVDKVFTYATPHNGIEMAGLNVPQWLNLNDMNNFNQERMAGYLNLAAAYSYPGREKRVDWLPASALSPDRFFCLVGTNRGDYEVAMGLSRTFAGHGSDGLVRVENASVWGCDDTGKVTRPCPTAYVFRSHSGYFGIVNSEEGYQNLVRFLFGNVRVDMWADIHSMTPPAAIVAAERDDKAIEAIHQLEVLASPRGKLWYLTRRVSEEDSVACLDYARIRAAKPAEPVRVYLSSVFLGTRWQVDVNSGSLAYNLTFRIRVPDYTIDRVLWLNEHYEGAVLFAGDLKVEIPVDKQGVVCTPDGSVPIRLAWNNGPVSVVDCAFAKGQTELSVPFARDAVPGISGILRFVVTPWQ